MTKHDFLLKGMVDLIFVKITQFMIKRGQRKKEIIMQDYKMALDNIKWLSYET